jgi:hypothetical protein
VTLQIVEEGARYASSSRGFVHTKVLDYGAAAGHPIEKIARKRSIFSRCDEDSTLGRFPFEARPRKQPKVLCVPIPELHDLSEKR